jgi:hypothetical protein
VLRSSRYLYVVEAGYADPDSGFLSEGELIHPHLCYTKEKTKKDEIEATTYLPEVFDATMPRYRVRRRLKNYIEYLEGSDWQSETDEDEPTPIALFVRPTKAGLIYCKRAIKRLLEDVWDAEDVRMWFTTVEKIREFGVMGAYGKR